MRRRKTPGAAAFATVALLGTMAAGGNGGNGPEVGRAAASPGTRGPSGVQEDARTAVVVPPAARGAVLKEMRQMLAALNGVLTAVARTDPEGAARAARSGGTAIAVDADPAVAARLPERFAALGMDTHRAFDAVARLAEEGGPRDTLLARLGRLTGNCVACHETYRLVVEDTGGR